MGDMGSCEGLRNFSGWMPKHSPELHFDPIGRHRKESIIIYTVVSDDTPVSHQVLIDNGFV